MCDWLFVCLIALDQSAVIVLVCVYTGRHARCLDIEMFIVKLSELSGRAEMDISLCDSQRSNCHTSPKTSLLHHAAMEGSGEKEGREGDGVEEE